jgi:hypothetical protein
LKRLVISIGGLLAVTYLGALHSTIQPTPANGSQHSIARPAAQPLSEPLRQNKKVSDKLSALLRQQNPLITDLQAASQGVTNLGELFAAVHVSQNLNDQLKTKEQTGGSLHTDCPRSLAITCRFRSMNWNGFGPTPVRSIHGDLRSIRAAQRVTADAIENSAVLPTRRRQD